MTENKTKVSEELSKAGETSLITPLLLKLDKLRIVSTSDIEDEEFLFNINGKPCLPRKDLTVIIRHPENPDCPWEWNFRTLFGMVMLLPE